LSSVALVSDESFRNMAKYKHACQLIALMLMLLVVFARLVLAADTGLITRPSAHSAQETIERFKNAVRSKGWIVFTEIDHAAAAKQVGLDMKPRTVILFGNPKIGTAAMQKAATLAIDNPPKALVWEDDNGKVWLTYNSGEYIAAQIYPRHGLSMPPDVVKNIEQLLSDLSEQATR
jgi:uncharacterized protein (DUF302 family)